MGDLHSEPDAGREMYRAGRLELHGLGYFVIDRPDPTYPFAESAPLWVDLWDTTTADGLPEPEPGHFAGRFFVSEWNACIYVSAARAELHWTGEAYDRGPGGHYLAGEEMPLTLD